VPISHSGSTCEILQQLQFVDEQEGMEMPVAILECIMQIANISPRYAKILAFCDARCSAGMHRANWPSGSDRARFKPAQCDLQQWSFR
jgi:hypothetical protein